MIHGSSNDPVLIKRIPLRIWKLRDEVEATIKRKLEDKQKDLNDLKYEYRQGGNPSFKGEVEDESSVGDVKPEEDTGEDEMAAALAEAETGEEEEGEESEEIGEEISGDDTGEDEMATALAEAEGSDSSDDSKKDESEQIKIKQRVPDLKPEKFYSALTLLGEIAMDKVHFFCSEKFIEGQSIVIEFLVPNHFVVNANVKYCRTYNMQSRIISVNSLPFRTVAEFTFLKAGERTMLRNFLASIEPDVGEYSQPVQEVTATDDSGMDDFDDLDDL